MLILVTDLLILDDLQVSNNGSSTTTATNSLPGGLVVFQSSNILVENSRFDENIGVGGAVGAVSNLLVNNSSFDGNLPTSVIDSFTGVTFGLGVLVESIPGFENGSQNVFVTNSTFNGNTGTASAFGLAIVGSLQMAPITPITPLGPQITNVGVENCIAAGTNTSGGGSTLLSFTEGITLLVRNAYVKNCKSQSTTSTNTLSDHLVGLETSGSFIVVEDCVVETVTGTATRMTGFDLESQSDNIQIKNCTVLNVINSNTAVGAFAYGFGLLIPIIADGLVIQFDGDNIVVDSCLASNVHVIAGFTVPTPPTPGILPTVPPPTLSAGFLINGTTSPILTNSVSSNNDVGVLVYDYYPPAAGFGGLTTNAVIDSNRAINNTFAGFVDETTPAVSANAFTNNYARTNGPGSADNYVGIATNNIATWVLPGPPPAPTTISKLTNLSIQP